MSRRDLFGSLVTLAAMLAAVVGCAGVAGWTPPAGMPGPEGSAPVPASWVRHETRGVAIALPPELLAGEPQVSAFGEVILQATRTTPRDPITAGGLEIGWLGQAYVRDNPGASARWIVDDWILPWLGDLSVDRVAGRDLEIDGSAAHEILLVTEPGPSGEALAIDLLVIQRGTSQAWIQYALGGDPGALPGDGFLPEIDAIVASIAFAPDAEPTPLAAGCPALDVTPGSPGKLAFVGEYAICVADLGSGEVKPIVRSEMDPYRGPEGRAPYSWLEWSPDGRRLAFVRSTYPAAAAGPLTDELVVANADGTEPRVIPGPPDASDYHGLSWSPDGHRLAASIDRWGCTGCASIWLLDVASETWTSLAMADEIGSDVEAPDWAPDGRHIVAMVAPSDADYHLRPSVGVIDDTGRLVTTLVEEADFSASVAWSSDGRSIAVLDSFLRDGELRTMRPDGSGSRLVSAVDGIWRVRWAFADGALLVEREETDDPGGIWVLPLDGSPTYRLVGGTYPTLVGD